LGAAAVWGVVTIIKLRINQVNQETEDLSKGTEISLEDLATPGVKSAETPGVTNALEEPVKPDYGPRPPVESPQA
jgi:hypothetical protein